MKRGPNLLNNFNRVALRAKIHRFAVCYDIEKMYHQILVPEHEQDTYRFISEPRASRTVRSQFEFELTFTPDRFEFGVRITIRTTFESNCVRS